MENNSELENKINEICEKNKVILKGHIVISRGINCIVMAHYCRSDLFYKDLSVIPDVFKVNKISKKNIKEIIEVLKNSGYKKVWGKGVFSVYGDLRPLAVEAGIGKWSSTGIVENEKYGTNFLITAVFYK